MTWNVVLRFTQNALLLSAMQVRPLAIYVAGIAAGTAAIVFGLYELAYVREWRFFAKSPLDGMHIARLTCTGRVKDASISPDGKYVVFVNFDSGRRGVRVYQEQILRVVSKTALPQN